MLKKIGLPVIALAGMLAMAPHQANAAVRFGFTVGAPVYPVYPVCRPAPVVVRRPFIGPVVGWHRDWRFRR